MSAHPRSRGENWSAPKLTAGQSGSSPLTRGKRPVWPEGQPGAGLIPAHAGKTYRVIIPIMGPGAHPRSRGENFPGRAGDDPGAGSSPLTRGKPRLGVRAAYGVGLIPAHAGKTPTLPRSSRRSRAHPRSRGENEQASSLPYFLDGSSPLTRGKHFLTCAFIAQIDQILESLELCAFSESYSSQDVYATDAPRDRVRSIGLAPRSSRGAS